MAPGKIILLGEHGVVFGHPAIAASLPWGITASGTEASRCRLIPPAELSKPGRALLAAAFARAAEATGHPKLEVRLSSTLPVSMGLGSSAALSVALSKLFLQASRPRVLPREVLALALQLEQEFHGTPSGIDHTCSTLGGVILYRRKPLAVVGRARRLSPAKPLRVLVAIAGQRSPTKTTVAALRARRERWPERYRRLFLEIGRLAEEGAEAIERGDLASLGDAMNVNHGLLSAMGLSSPVLDTLVHRLRMEGALGAKFTGAGGDGGAVVGLFEKPESVGRKLEREGISCRVAELGVLPIAQREAKR